MLRTITDPFILRTWESWDSATPLPADGGAGKGTDFKEVLAPFETSKNVNLTPLSEVLAAFRASFAGRKEQTLFSFFPNSKLTEDVNAFLEVLKVAGNIGPGRQNFEEALLRQAAPAAPAIRPPPILSAVEMMQIVGFKAAFRQARRAPPESFRKGPSFRKLGSGPTCDMWHWAFATVMSHDL